MGLRRTLLWLFVFSTSVSQAIPRSEIPEIYDDLDGSELALRLVLDGKIALAQRVHADLPSDQGPSATLARVRGLLAEEAGDLRVADRELALAAMRLSSVGRVSEELSVERSRVASGLQKWSECVRLLTPSVAIKKAETAITYIRCLAAAGEKQSAFDVSAQAVRAHPQNVALIRERIAILVTLDLVQTAAREARLAVQQMAKASDTATLAFELYDLILPRDPRSAQALLELAVLRFGDHEVRAKRAQHLFRQHQALMSATEFAALAPSHPQYYLPASELSRLTGRDVEGARLAMMIPDARDRFRQRATFDLASGRIPIVGTLAASFDRTFPGRLDSQDEDWAYAIAYSRLRTGAWREQGPLSPAGLLSRIRRSDLLEKSVQLRSRIGDCASQGATRCSFE